jgi:hypothetical protein
VDTGSAGIQAERAGSGSTRSAAVKPDPVDGDAIERDGLIEWSGCVDQSSAGRDNERRSANELGVAGSEGIDAVDRSASGSTPRGGVECGRNEEVVSDRDWANECSG